MFKRIFKKKIAAIAIALLYSIVFTYGYREFLYGGWQYAGFEIIEGRVEENYFRYFSILLAVVPMFFHNGIKQISSFISVFLYFILYVPIIITYYYNLDGSIFYVIFLQFLFAISMILLFIADRIRISNNMMLPSRINLFKVMLVLTWLISMYVAFIYRDSLNFASYEDVYIQRELTSNIGQDVFSAYLIAWLANVLVPFTATYGLFSKKYFYFYSSVVASLIIYMSSADKAILAFPFIILALFFIFRKINFKIIFTAVGSFLLVIMVGTLVYGWSLFSALFWMRTIGNGGLLAVYYHKFFQDHPNTYYTHINVINKISDAYPYGDLIIGQVVGRHYWSSDQNANANFWATDGIAALGDIGILVAGIFLFLTFLLFNKISQPFNKLFLICIFVPFTSSLLNQSLFSSLVTGGGFLTLLILSFKSTIQNPFINENTHNSRS